MDKKYVVSGLGYAILGMLLGIHMAASHNHGQLVTHAHILLLGFVVSFIYALCHKLWLQTPNPLLSRIQYYSHHLGTAGLVVGLFLIYGSFVEPARVEVPMAIASLVALLAMVLMKVMVIQSFKASRRAQVGTASSAGPTPA